MEIKTFSKKEAIKFGWKTVKENLEFFIVLGIIAGGISLFFGILYKLIEVKGENPILCVGIDVIDFILSMIITLGLIKICLNFYDGLKSKISDLFSQYQLVFKYIGATIL